ncbi:hypothetical protein AMTR_s00043p00216380 [Amborella trichopoda]|uniref:Uncharacterized protein n=1 Tax=Amborella trichopoda TaxID=13333 RepID=W1PXR2_AMBTC|nr:hypothetical protein AMTR_s00043p00216380 [Amborella trichopoda]
MFPISFHRPFYVIRLSTVQVLAAFRMVLNFWSLEVPKGDTIGSGISDIPYNIKPLRSLALVEVAPAVFQEGCKMLGHLKSHHNLQSAKSYTHSPHDQTSNDFLRHFFDNLESY